MQSHAHLKATTNNRPLMFKSRLDLDPDIPCNNVNYLVVEAGNEERAARKKRRLSGAS